MGAFLKNPPFILPIKGKGQGEGLEKVREKPPMTVSEPPPNLPIEQNLWMT